ncbi:MAG TPA: long-chain fatty acid--CoA ligase, partial [Alphaproteobacteria bacterium]|nr:long-chain fatty acid--CoA ligase [Alphaproteobacteria bacterium]
MAALEKLQARFAAAGETPAVIDPGGAVTTYSALLARIETLSDRFAAQGVGHGISVQLIGDFGAEDIAWLIALWTRGAIVTPVAPTSLEVATGFAKVGEAEFIARPREDT